MSEEPGGTLLCGLDEAGLGPLLGPLTIGYAVLRVPTPDADPWDLLKKRVGGDSKSWKGRIAVADSKRVFTRNALGRKRLEETALTFASLLREGGLVPTVATELLFGALRPSPETIAKHPWYEHLPELPHEHEVKRLELSAALLAREFELQSSALVDLGVRVVPAGELNLSYIETQNKSETVWLKTLEVLRHFWREHGHANPQVTVDLQGARTYYGPPLARAFPDASVKLLHQGPLEAAYDLTERGAPGIASPGRRMKLHFRAKGEEHSFAVALASCMAKYARETAMQGFNAYFLALQPGLRPTAGYTTDGRRWLEDAEEAVRASQIEKAVLVRDR